MYKGFDLGAVIPVRLGSSRVSRKALLPVGESRVSLLAWKIRQLKKVMPHENIYVSTEADELKDIALNEGVQIHHRDFYLADGHKASFSEVITGIVKDIPHEHIAWVTAVVPLMSPQEYLAAFEAYKATVTNASPKNDSLISVNLLKEYFWDESGPINYQANKNHTISQNLPNIYRVTNGLYMAPKAMMLEKNYLIGENPNKFIVSKMAGVDIDEYEDYEMSQGLFNFYVKENDDLTKKSHIFLDFDGVIFSSIKEAYVVAMLASGDAKDLSDIDFESEHFKRFSELRHLIGPAWNYLFIIKHLNYGEKLVEVFVKTEEAAEFEEKFFRFRRLLMERDFDYWKTLSSPYEEFKEVIELIRKFPSKFSIITTKDDQSVHSLLKSTFGIEGIPVFGAKVFSKDGSKAETIENLMRLQGVTDALYIDDSELHLNACKDIPGLNTIQAGWGYVTPGRKRQNEEDVISAVERLLGCGLA